MFYPSNANFPAITGAIQWYLAQREFRATEAARDDDILEELEVVTRQTQDASVLEERSGGDSPIEDLWQWFVLMARASWCSAVTGGKGRASTAAMVSFERSKPFWRPGTPTHHRAWNRLQRLRMQPQGPSWGPGILAPWSIPALQVPWSAGAW